MFVKNMLRVCFGLLVLAILGVLILDPPKNPELFRHAFLYYAFHLE